MKLEREVEVEKNIKLENQPQILEILQNVGNKENERTKVGGGKSTTLKSK